MKKSFLLMILAIATCAQAKDVTVKSPNGALVVTVSNLFGILNKFDYS